MSEISNVNLMIPNIDVPAIILIFLNGIKSVPLPGSFIVGVLVFQDHCVSLVVLICKQDALV